MTHVDGGSIKLLMEYMIPYQHTWCGLSKLEHLHPELLLSPTILHPQQSSPESHTLHEYVYNGL